MSDLTDLRQTRSLVFAAFLATLLLVAVGLRADEPRRSTRHASDHYGSVAFSPDGQRLAVGSRKGKIHIWDLQNRRVTRVLRQSENRVVEHLAWRPDGGRLAVCRFGSPLGSRLSLYDVDSTKWLSGRVRKFVWG